MHVRTRLSSSVLFYRNVTRDSSFPGLLWNSVSGVSNGQFARIVVTRSFISHSWCRRCCIWFLGCRLIENKKLSRPVLEFITSRGPNVYVFLAGVVPREARLCSLERLTEPGNFCRKGCSRREDRSPGPHLYGFNLPPTKDVPLKVAFGTGPLTRDTLAHPG